MQAVPACITIRTAMKLHHASTASLLSRLRRHALWLPLLGLVVLALQVLAAMAVPASASARAADGLFVAELCTAHGIASTAPTSAPADSDRGALHDCCKLCAAGGPLLFAAPPITAVSASTFALAATFGVAAHTPRLSRNSHPPRAPPLV